MAISVTRPQRGGYGWLLNATSADASLCEELLAAPAAGIAIQVMHITINSASAISITIGEDEAANNVVSAWLGPISMAANSSIQWDFPDGFVLTAAKSLTVDSSGAGVICVFAWGKYV